MRAGPLLSCFAEMPSVDRVGSNFVSFSREVQRTNDSWRFCQSCVDALRSWQGLKQKCLPRLPWLERHFFFLQEDLCPNLLKTFLTQIDAQNSKASAARPKILVVDDEQWLREMVSMALQQRGFEVVEAENGKLGVKVACRERPELILCDVNMDTMDGYATLSTLRDRPVSASIPFILMTGLADEAGMRHGMRLGADYFLSKPFSIDALYAAVDACLSKERPPLQSKEKSIELPEKARQNARNALNGIVAYAEILARDAESLQAGEVAEIGQDIREAGKRLEQFIAKRARKKLRFTGKRQQRSTAKEPRSRPGSTIGTTDALKFVVASVLHDIKGEFSGLGFVLRDIQDSLPNNAVAQSAYIRLFNHLRHVEAHLELVHTFIESGLPLAEPVNVIETLRDVESLCVGRLPKNVSFQLLLPRDGAGWNILANRDGLIGICRELIRNAGTAMRDTGGKLAISLIRTTDGIEIHVKDTGPGFPAEIKNRVFLEPVGKTTRAGWGLYLAQRVATAMGGFIKVVETSEAGSAIALWLQRLRTKGK